MIDIDNLSVDKKIELATTSNDINILKILAKDKGWFVRCNVASNKNTPVKILNLLTKDTIFAVRYCVAYNTNTTVEILKEFINDKDETIRKISIERLAILKGLNCFV